VIVGTQAGSRRAGGDRPHRDGGAGGSGAGDHEESSKAGVAATRFDVVSTGETNLVCTEQTEGCWARNRRGHFQIIAK
jgi:hypothetical protein